MLKALPERLLPWFEENKRDLPWRADRQAYHIWLSEIMLQQTRVEAVKGYYRRFLEALPTIAHLARADETLLLKLWEGLGYYSRVRNLQKAAKCIMTEHGGEFPRDYEAIRKLPGIGAYTAGAISSICFDQPRAAVDGNVLRVLARYLASDAPVDKESTKKEWGAALEAVYPPGQCGAFTQALMELGATVCPPNGAPRCQACPLEDLCRSRKENSAGAYPVKKSKKPRKKEKRTVFILRHEGRIALCRRPERGLLAGLWQLPDVEGALDDQQALAQAAAWGLRPTGIEKIIHRTHIFTHVEWELTGCYLSCAAEGSFMWAEEAAVRESIPLPTAYRQFL